MSHDSLARLFRTLNSNLLYVNSWATEKLLKIPFLISNIVYRSWRKKAHPANNIEITVDRDIQMCVDNSKAMGAAFYWMGFHELNEWRFLNKHLTAEMVFVDVGANQGEYALFAAKRLTKGKVLAFEPVDFFFDLLEDNTARNRFSNIQVFPFGLSDAYQRLPIYAGPAGAGEHEGLATIFQSQVRNRLVQEIELQIFDDLVPGLGLTRMDFIKIDVEGAELMVLKGARKSIEKYRPWVMLEINAETFQNASYTVDEIRTFFDSLQYACYLIGKGGILKKTPVLPTLGNVIYAPY